MAHDKIYGICENKCRHEVYKKTEADETFLAKSAAASLYAVKNHATSKQIYGVGTNKAYGHVQITADLNVPKEATTGRALAASAGKTLNDKITTLRNKLDEVNRTTFMLSERIDEVERKTDRNTEDLSAVSETLADVVNHIQTGMYNRADIDRMVRTIMYEINQLKDRVSALENAQ